MSQTAEERRTRILHEVMAYGGATVSGLAELLGVTTETIRKDLALLEERGVVSKGHGTVTMATSLPESGFSQRDAQHRAEKTLIAERASALVPQNASVFLDTSTTVLRLASLLALRDDLVVITNSVDACRALAGSGSQVLMTGGLYRTRSNSCVGSWAMRTMEGVNVDVAFMGCNGFSAEGPTIHSYQEVEFKRAAIRQARRSVLLADTSKLGHKGLHTFAAYSDLDLLVFERKLNAAEREALPRDATLME